MLDPSDSTRSHRELVHHYTLAHITSHGRAHVPPPPTLLPSTNSDIVPLTLAPIQRPRILFRVRHRTYAAPSATTTISTTEMAAGETDPPVHDLRSATGARALIALPDPTVPFTLLIPDEATPLSIPTTQPEASAQPRRGDIMFLIRRG
jgi:hypothetical protein